MRSSISPNQLRKVFKMLTDLDELKVYPIAHLGKFVPDLDLDMTQFGDVGLDFVLEDNPTFRKSCLC